MPGALDLDFSKVKRKIRSVPGSPKGSSSPSPGSIKAWTVASFVRVSRKHKKLVPNSTPDLNKDMINNNLHQKNSSPRRKSAEELIPTTCKSNEELHTFEQRTRVCVILNDDQLLLVRIFFVKFI